MRNAITTLEALADDASVPATVRVAAARHAEQLARVEARRERSTHQLDINPRKVAR